MPRSSPQHTLARRALIEEVPGRRGWLQQGAAVLGISVLGLGVAGSVAVSGSAHAPDAQLGSTGVAQQVQEQREPGVAMPAAFGDAARSTAQLPLSTAALSHLADQRAETLAAVARRAQVAAQAKAVRARTESLSSATKAAVRKAARLRAQRAHERAVREAAARKAAASAERRQAAKAARAKAVATRAKAPVKAAHHSRSTAVAAPHRSGHASLPITSGYHIAARFGDTGSWSRYHTGLDFAAPMGTTIRAIASGVVTHAGSGRAGWAGRYVTIRHADGRSTLYAHMSSVSVHEGEGVSGGERIGSVGMTGRTFGPHVHVELYPRGVRPGSVYSAVNPAPWMRARGLHP